MASNDNDINDALATALADLVKQVDLADYRDSLGHPMTNNLAYQKAQAMVERYGLTHDRLCWALMKHGENVEHIALALDAKSA